MSKPEKDTAALSEAISRLEPHDHLCLIYETREEQFAAVVPFMRLGLARGEQCLYIVDDNTAQAVLDALRAGAIDVEAALASGALVIAAKQDAYLRQGYFDPEWMIQFLAQATADARAAGFTALRATAEMTWALGGDPGVERLIEYEAKLNHFFPTRDILAICQYNRRRFSPAIILDVIRTHPLVIFGGLVCRNPYYVPPDELLGADDASREVERMLTSLREREQVEAELRESEERYRALAETAQDMIFVINRADRVQYVNAAAARAFGRQPEDILGQLRANLFPSDAVEQQNPDLQRLFETGQPFVSESPIVFPGGEYWLNTQLVPIRNQAGEVTAVMGISRDVTERKRAELEISRQARTMAALYETTRGLVMEQNISALLNTIVERAARLLGAGGGGLYLCEPEQGQVRCVVSYNTPRDFTGITLKYGEGAAGLVAQTGQPLIINDYHKWAGRAVIYEEEQPFHAVLSVPMRWQSEVIGVIHVLGYGKKRHFTEADQDLVAAFANQAAIAVQNARLIEQARSYAADLEKRVAERTGQLESSLREKETLLREVYHRVKNNLQVIRSLLNLQVNRLEAEPARQALLEARERVGAMALVHEKLYQTSGLERINFGEYVAALAKNLQAAYCERPDQVHLSLQIEQIFLGLDAAILCGLLLTELITNSLKHAFPGNPTPPPEISIHLISAGPERYWLRVADNGVGLPDYLDWRNAPTLGLQLVILLTEQLRGEINLHDEPGAVFSIAFQELKYKERN